MALITYFRREDGIRRLLEQPGDVAPRAAHHAAILREQAGQPYRTLFAYYVEDLARALSIAGPWWDGTVKAREDLGMSRQEAIVSAFTARAAGAASHPKAVWIVRTYWLKCEALNRQGAYGPEIYPETLLLKWLIDAGEDDLVDLIACMPYWPIGLDVEGNWC